MAITDNARIDYEAGQEFNDFEAMTTDDNVTFAASFSPWSRKSGFEIEVRPYGLITGGKIVPAVSGNDDQVDVAAATAYMPGESGASPNADGVVSVSAATDLACARPSTDTHLIYSIVINTSGAFAAVAGTEGTSFSATRGAAGGPPLVADGAVEVGQVRLSAQASAVIAATEIRQIVGLSQERWDNPGFAFDYVNGAIEFYAALPLIHTGSIPKKVYVRGYSPIFAPLQLTSDFTPAENTHSTSSEETYDGPLGSVSSSLGQASFTVRLEDGHTDQFLNIRDDTIWFRFKQDRNRSPYSLTAGKVGISRSYDVGARVQADVTISADQATVDFAS